MKLKLNLLLQDQNLLVNIFLLLLCLFLSITFPTQNSVQIITKNLFFLIFLPIFYIKIILKKRLASFGFNLKNNLLGLKWGTGMFFFLLFFFYFLIKYTAFRENYHIPIEISTNFWFFLGYELFIVNFIIFINELFFRGFLLSVFRKNFYHWSIAIQAGIYFFTLFFTKAFSWQITPFILFSITGGILAYKTKSFFYSYFAHIFVIIILDTYIIFLSR